MMHRILIVDDDPGVQFFLSEFVKKEGYDFDVASSGEETLRFISINDYSLVLLDERMPGMSGIEILESLKTKGYKMPVIMITAYGTKEFALKAIQEGAYDFFTKPVDIEIVRTIIKRALEKYELQKEIEELRQKAIEDVLEEEIVAKSPEMLKVMELAKKVSVTDVTVLVTGESGSGKELIAKSIHRMSSRKEGQFVSINCAAIPETLLEAELFGYEKGAFTGAAKQHVGKFERASGGTILLDEIGDISPGLQSKLLRVLQEREVERLGGTKPIKIDVRVISATNKNIDDEVANKRFREDLFYRIRVFEIHVPPLRERKEDIPVLAEKFLKKYSKEIGKDIKCFDNMAMKFFLTYLWPGNVREMENLIQRAIILEEKGDRSIIRGDSILGLVSVHKTEHLFFHASAKERIADVKENEEKKLIMEALIKSHWKRQEAAKFLGMSRKSLFNKMKKYGI